MTAEQPRQIIARLDHLIAQLEGTLPAEEHAAGWTEQSRMAFLAFFERLRQSLEAGASAPRRPSPSIAREMDHWGITGGRLLEEAAEISLALRRLPGAEAR